VLLDADRDETRIVVGAIERPPAILPDPRAILDGRVPLADAVKAVAPHLSDESHALHVAALRRAIALATAENREAA
jgi:aerobic carbon-monoxide dehydrogenase medium subunit